MSTSVRSAVAAVVCCLALAAGSASASAYTITSGIEDGQATNASSITIEYFDLESTSATCTLGVTPIACTTTSATFSPPEGNHVFTVRGSNAELLLGKGLPTFVSFTVDRTDPVVQLTGGPADGSTTILRNIKFGIATNEGTLACRFDGADLPCNASGANVIGLALGRHELVVEATDAAGNIGRATRNFTVIEGQPTITSAPKSKKQGSAIKLELLCPDVCKLKGTVRLGGKKLKLKDVSAAAGQSTVTVKFSGAQKKKIKAALKKRKKVSVVFSLAGGNSKTVKIKK